jgi:hypothetical protein
MNTKEAKEEFWVMLETLAAKARAGRVDEIYPDYGHN